MNRNKTRKAVIVLHGLAAQLALFGCMADVDDLDDGDPVDEAQQSLELKSTIWSCKVLCGDGEYTTYTVCAKTEGGAEGTDDADTACKDAKHGSSNHDPSCTSTGNKC